MQQAGRFHPLFDTVGIYNQTGYIPLKLNEFMFVLKAKVSILIKNENVFFIV